MYNAESIPQLLNDTKQHSETVLVFAELTS